MKRRKLAGLMALAALAVAVVGRADLPGVENTEENGIAAAADVIVVGNTVVVVVCLVPYIENENGPQALEDIK